MVVCRPTRRTWVSTIALAASVATRSFTLVNLQGNNNGVLSDWPLESAPIPDPVTDLNGESFSACLLVMDDNFRLPEWLAYHYHVLPLRYLVIAVDPNSHESPDAVLQQFRRELDMTIVSWGDSDYLGDIEPLPDTASTSERSKRYLIRQRQFLGACMEHLYRQNKTWTALWDTDEYISYHGFSFPRKQSGNDRTIVTPPDMSQPGTILRYLKESSDERCVSMMRILVGSKETPGLLNETTLPPSIDPRRLDTVRFRYRGRPGRRIHGMGKSLLNVQNITKFPITVPNPHRPVPELCPQPLGDSTIGLEHSPFYLRHYIGSWEAYSYRVGDSRRGHNKNYDAYMLRATTQSIVYEDIMPKWLAAFVKSMGDERAVRLLKDIGIDPAYNASFKIDAWKPI